MNPLLGFLFLFMVSLESIAQGLPSDWKLVELPGVQQAWIHDKKPGHMIVLIKNRTRETLSLKGASRQQILAGVLAMRSLTLSQLGFTDFKIGKFNYKSGTPEQLDLQGSYRRPGNIPVLFFEKQYFNDTNYDQVSYFIEGPLVSGRGRGPVVDEKEIESLLQRVSAAARLPAQEDQVSGTEADTQETCLDCQLPKVSGPEELSKQIQELAKSTEQCAADAWLFDPEKKSVLQENGFGRLTESRAETAARAFMTCNYGALSGAGKSFRDVVMAVPNLIGLSWQGLKSAGGAVTNFEYRKWLEKFSIQKVADAGFGAISVTKDSVAKAFNTASLKVYNSYKEAGVTGSIAAVAQAAYNSSPHKAIGQFMSKIGSEIYSALATEWNGLMCMEPEALSQAMCEIAGYIAVDVVTGKLLLSGLSKSGKLREAIAAVRKKMEKVPLARDLITRNLKAVDGSRCGKFDADSWKIDSGFKLQGQDLSVLREGTLILARGLSPHTGKLECFEVGGGLAAKIGDRIVATEKRAEKFAGSGTDFFSPGSKAYARSGEEFVEGINSKVGVEVSGGQTRKIATALSEDPQAMEQYGALARNLQDLKERAKLPGLAADELSNLDKTIQSAEESLKMINGSLPLIEKPSYLNLKSINQAVLEASASNNPETIQLMNRALFEFNKAAKKNSGDFKGAVEAWEASLKKERRHLTSREIDRAKECLFSAGATK